MEPLSIKDMQNLNEGIQQLYTLDTIDTFGVDALLIVDRLVPGDVPEFHVTSLRTHQVSSTFLPSFPGFTERDRTVLNLLRPHLFQAHSNARKHHQLQQKLSALEQSVDCLGLIILDTEGRIQSIAPQAAIWLETYSPKPTCSLQLPDHLWSWVRYQVNSLTKNSDLPGACLPLRIQQTGRELIIRLVIEQFGQRYLLLLEEQSLSLFASLELLGLSQRETEILAWVMQGKNNQQIAVQLNINIGTVRKHLENIYDKFGVHSRTEAISQALIKLGLLHSLPLHQ